jgi:uncharacterized protein (TIGR02001 family)
MRPRFSRARHWKITNVLHPENELNMLHKSKFLAAAVCALFALPAWASDVAQESPVTANISIVNNYVFRGISRTNTFPAVQGGVDLAADNGIYVGAWGSNVSWLADRGMTTAGSSLELDAYAGIKNNFFTDFNYDFGLVRYHFPAVYNPGMTNADTDEIHGALAYLWLAVKYSYSLGNAFGIADSRGSHYLDVSASVPISDSGVTLGAHYGKQTFVGTSAVALAQAGTDPSYRDWQLSVSAKVAGWVLGLAYSGTNSSDGGYYTTLQGVNMGRKQAVVSVRRTF